MFNPALSLLCSGPGPLKRLVVSNAEIYRLVRPSTLVLLMLCLFAPSAWTQMSANLSGIVTDQSGATVSGAAVTARDVDTGLSRSAVTNQAGRYQLFALPVGQYEVRVKKDGFAEGVRTGIILVVGQDAVTDLSLRVGAVSEEVKALGTSH